MSDSTSAECHANELKVSPVTLKLLSVGLCIVIFSLALYVIFIFRLERLGELQRDKYEITQSAQIQTFTVYKAVNQSILALEQDVYLKSADPQWKTQHQQELTYSLDSLQALMEVWDQPQALQIYTALRLSVHQYTKLLNEATALYKRSYIHQNIPITDDTINHALAVKVLTQLQPQAGEINSQIKDFTQLLYHMLQVQSQTISSEIQLFKRIIAVILILGSSIVLMLICIIIRELLRYGKTVKQQLSLLQSVQAEMQRSYFQLAEKEVQLRSVMNNTSDEIFAIDRNYNLTVINKTLQEKYVGKGIQINVGSNCCKLYENKTEHWKELFERALAGEQVFTSSKKSDDKGCIFTATQYNPIRTEDGNVAGVSVIIQNIPLPNEAEEQLPKLLEEAYLKAEEIKLQEAILLDTMAQMQSSQEVLQQKEAHLSAVINTTDDKIVAIDTNYTITFINASLKEACTRRGILLSEGTDYRQVFTGIEEKVWKPSFERAFAGEKFVLTHVNNIMGEGIVEIAFNPVKNKQDKVTGICIFIHDITRQVQAEQQIQQLYLQEQETTEELQTQQEELRQNLEELMSTQEELEKTQNILRLKEARLRALINNTADAIFSIDIQYSVTVMNNIMKELYQTRYTFIKEGENFLNYLPVDKKKTWKEYFDKALQGDYFVVTWEDIHLSQVIYHELSFNPVKTDNEEIVGVSVFIKDITERRLQELERIRLLKEAADREEELMSQSEMMRDNLHELMLTRDELEAKEAQLTSQMDAINKSNSLVEFDLNGQILFANDSFLHLMQYSREELIGKNYELLIPEDERSLASNLEIEENLRKGLFHEAESKRVTKNGELIWIKATYNPVNDAAGKPYKVIKFAFNITDRVQDAIEKKRLYEKISVDAEELRMQEEELRQNLEELKVTQEALVQQKEHIQEKEARLRALIDNTEDDIFAIDTNYTITILNKAVQTRYEKQGLSLQVGYNIFSIIPTANTAYWRVNFDKAIAGEKFSLVDQVITKDGEMYFDVSFNPIRNDRNQVIGISVLSRNINQYKMAEKENLQTIDVLRKIQERVASMNNTKENEIEEYKKKVEKLKSEMNKKIKLS